jgi:hypothetical protein
MVDTGTGPAAYYADVMQAVLTLAVTAPPGPPANGTAFLDRLEPGWLETAYAGDASRLAALATARRHLGDISLRYRTLLDRLGPALDHGSALTDADAWYFILEGTREQSVAEAQALALTELGAGGDPAVAPVGLGVRDRDLLPGQRVEGVEQGLAVLLDWQHELPAVIADELGGRLHRVQRIGGDDRAVQVDLAEHGCGRRHLVRLRAGLGLRGDDRAGRLRAGQRRQQVPLVTLSVLRAPDGLAVQPDRH